MHDNHQHTLGKAVLSGRLNGIIRFMDHARDAYKTSVPKNKKSLTLDSLVLSQFEKDFADAQARLEALYRELSASLVQETTLGREYDKELFERTLELTLADVQKQFGHQPNICATLQMFVMLLRTRLDFYANFMHVRTQACVEDRSKGNNSCYDLNGEPNKKGSGECDHCPHVV